MPVRVYVCDASDLEKLKALMEYDPYLDKSIPEDQIAGMKSDKETNIIFARQDYQIKDGASLGMDPNKCYLYLNANEDFLNNAEPKLVKNVASARRAEKETEDKVISLIETEISNSEMGIGSIFG